MTTEVTAEELLKYAVHFGHKKTKWNPKMKPFIYGEKNGVHIFDLEKTAACLTEAKAFVKRLASEGRTILFIGTKPQAEMIVKEAAEKCAMPYITKKWIGGFFTNFATVSKRISYLRTLKTEEKSGGFEKYVKHEALKKRREIEKLEERFSGVEKLTRLPDAIFVADAVRDELAIREARRMKVPVIAIVDTNANPDPVDYVIPANDDALQSIRYIVEQIADEIAQGKSTPKAQTA